MATATAAKQQQQQQQSQDDQRRIEEDLAWAEKGTMLRRVKKGKITNLIKVSIDEKKFFNYYSSNILCSVIPNSLKAVPVTELLEVRTGYSTDNLHNASKKYEFQESAPEYVCFSVIFSHHKFLHKSVDFAADTKETRDRWVSAMNHLLSIAKAKRIHFNENQFLVDKFKQADRNKNGTLSFDEIWHLLKKMNLQLSESYARAIFNESEEASTRDLQLNDKEFVNFFERLTDREELRLLMKQFSTEHVETWTVDDLQRFLTEIQKFPDVDRKKAESILDTFEPGQQDKGQEKLMGLMGMRRLLNSRWGNILKPDHEHIFMDMDQPLPQYFCNSSHNTYLTGSQIKGVASVEGYISALKRGARLLELDIFDGEGFPVITHKRTLIEPISLKNALESIKRCAFDVSPYPVILTIENHASLVQQRLMAEYFTDVLGDMLYKPSKDSTRMLFPSPNQLKKKFILRGKKVNLPDDDDEDSPNEKEGKRGKGDDEEKKHHGAVDSKLSSLIALPAVKLSNNVYEDAKKHPMDGSPSLSENKVITLYEANFPMHIYTGKRFTIYIIFANIASKNVK
ncbi:hypothetical protein WR25_22106 isoform B [Diploscapter pachys]|uniref:Phosphoinositide phospholipase C n=1 Tax=Diploscapter pachys TaxID=2018661 RepID=A0A2A2JGW0_9BILA|nr:hypothetical protein WR25_22106 isoform A [Diploscapter pachys]PAV60772.1 hypothetical protein WR25_22106 isoform B [Diploscapter pachys]